MALQISYDGGTTWLGTAALGVLAGLSQIGATVSGDWLSIDPTTGKRAWIVMTGPAASGVFTGRYSIEEDPSLVVNAITGTNALSNVTNGINTKVRFAFTGAGSNTWTASQILVYKN